MPEVSSTYVLLVHLHLRDLALLSQLLLPSLPVFESLIVLLLELSFSSRLNLLPPLRVPVPRLSQVPQQRAKETLASLFLVHRARLPACVADVARLVLVCGSLVAVFLAGRIVPCRCW